MLVAFMTDTLRTACVEDEVMRTTWPTDCADVALCLSVLDAATTLADLATLRLCSVRTLADRSSFVVVRHAVEIHSRSIDRHGRVIAVPNDDDLTGVRHLLLVGVVCAGEAVGEVVVAS